MRELKTDFYLTRIENKYKVLYKQNIIWETQAYGCSLPEEILEQAMILADNYIIDDREDKLNSLLKK